jgi:hypothetical protein
MDSLTRLASLPQALFEQLLTALLDLAEAV